jgi:hypothetical protein
MASFAVALEPSGELSMPIRARVCWRAFGAKGTTRLLPGYPNIT